MTNKVSMEATLPPSAEYALYSDLFEALRIPDYENPYGGESMFWSIAEAALKVARSGDYSGLCRLEARPCDFCSANGYFRAAQFAALFRKRNDVGDADGRESKALESFLEAEEACRVTNAFIWALRHGSTRESGDFFTPPVLPRVLHSAARECRRILGRCPSIDELPCYFGPGATTQVVRKLANARVKLGQMFACSENMLPRLQEVVDSMPDFIFRHPDDGESATVSVLIHDCKLSFVPKSYATFRSIAVEPWLNSFVQLGIGTVMARRLRAFGLDIRDQTANQKLALRASIDDSLATIDLSRASDSVSYQLVRELIPDDWFDLLSIARSSSISYRGKRAELSKFSSMGNGYTFPLQTLIFFTISRAVCREYHLPVTDVRAYGDDIVVPGEAYAPLTSILALLGFAVNEEKSFSSGPFRESCGCDYWQGMDVRPVFLHKRPDIFDLFILHNGLIRKGQDALAEIVRSYIPEPLVLYGPDGYGDGHLIGVPFVPTFKKRHRTAGWAGYVFDTYSKKPRRYTRPHAGDYLYPSYSIYRRGIGSFRTNVDLGDSVPGTRGYRRISIYTLDLTSIKAA